MIDVIEEGVQRFHPLAYAAVNALPLLAGMIRGTLSNGISRSVPSSSPYTLKVMPIR